MLLRKLYLLGHVILLSGFGIEWGVTALFAANWLFNEQRPIVGIIEDISITHQISQRLSDDPRYDQTTNIKPVSYDQIVLLAGQAPNEHLKQQASDYAMKTPKVRRVFNQITISTPTDSWRRIQDTLLTLVVRAKLLTTSHLRYHHFQITTENGEVFLLGKADPNEANLAALVIQKTSGIRQVTKIVEPI